jgi:hypothetical protein
VAVKLTALPDQSEGFETHARCLLRHTALDAILWVNLSRTEIAFTTLLP